MSAFAYYSGWLLIEAVSLFIYDGCRSPSSPQTWSWLWNGVLQVGRCIFHRFGKEQGFRLKWKYFLFCLWYLCSVGQDILQSEYYRFLLVINPLIPWGIPPLINFSFFLHFFDIVYISFSGVMPSTIYTRSPAVWGPGQKIRFFRIICFGLTLWPLWRLSTFWLFMSLIDEGWQLWTSGIFHMAYFGLKRTCFSALVGKACLLYHVQHVA